MKKSGVEMGVEMARVHQSCIGVASEYFGVPWSSSEYFRVA
jgi:hypothetical protein